MMSKTEFDRLPRERKKTFSCYHHSLCTNWRYLWPRWDLPAPRSD